jgi:hypothetical protein
MSRNGTVPPEVKDVSRSTEAIAGARELSDHVRDARRDEGADGPTRRTTTTSPGRNGRVAASHEHAQQLARKLRRLRRRRSIEPDEVSAVTGWSAEHLDALETGAIAPLLSEVVALAWIYRVELDALRPAELDEFDGTAPGTTRHEKPGSASRQRPKGNRRTAGRATTGGKG